MIKLKFLCLLTASLFTLNSNFSYSQVFQEKESYSIILLIDVSGSMSGEKINAAKEGAQKIISMYSKYDTEYSVLTYSGSCSNPIKDQLNFTQDTSYIQNFLEELSTSNNTPLGEAYRFASWHMKLQSKTNTQKLIFIIGDGGDDCKNLDEVLNELFQQDMLYQTISAGLEVDEKAKRDLQKIAIRSGGSYTDANPASLLQLEVPKTFLIPMVKIITGYSRKAPKDIFYGKYPKQTLVEYFDNAVFKLDSLSYLIHPDNYWGMKITIKDVPYIFNFSPQGFTYYIPEKNTWIDGELKILDNELTITATLEENTETEYHCRVKYLSQNRMELCLITYEEEDYCCKSKLSTDDSAFILYFTRLK
jgi:uncharacterized protein YegL